MTLLEMMRWLWRNGPVSTDVNNNGQAVISPTSNEENLVLHIAELLGVCDSSLLKDSDDG